MKRPMLAEAARQRLHCRPAGVESPPVLQAKLDFFEAVVSRNAVRSVRDLGHLVEKYFAPGKSALLSVGEQIDTRSAAGRLVLNVLASVSQWERAAIGERTATAMQHKASQGEYTGGWAPVRVAVLAYCPRSYSRMRYTDPRVFRALEMKRISRIRRVAAALERIS